MHSLRHTVVAVLLLGLSFGLYHLSLTPSEIGSATRESSVESASENVRADVSEFGSGDDVRANTNHSADSNTFDFQSQNSRSTPLNFQSPKSIEVPPIPSLSQTNTKPFSNPVSNSNFPPLPTTKEHQPATSSSSNSRTPVDSIGADGVQSIRYPDSPIESVNPSVKDSDSAGSRFVQQEPLNSARDEGLIAALKAQDGTNRKRDTDFVAGQPASDVPESTGDFHASNGLNPGTTTAGSFSASPIAASTMSDSFKIQPAGAEVSSVNANRLGGASPVVESSRMTQAELEQLNFRTVWPVVDELVEAEDYHTALKLLSRFYREETLNGPQRQRLLGWLDALAGKVIFSAEDHLAGQPYAVKPQETLADISKRWQVPVQLLANINGDNFVNREVVPAGTPLKQIEGPFHAELKLRARVITLYLGDLYAGRFPVVIGTSGEPKPGVFDVVLKSEPGYVWIDSNRNEYPPGSPENGYGTHWIGFAGSLCIHAVPDAATDGHRGCIGLSQEDAADLFGILSETSKLTIMP